MKRLAFQGYDLSPGLENSMFFPFTSLAFLLKNILLLNYRVWIDQRIDFCVGVWIFGV